MLPPFISLSLSLVQFILQTKIIFASGLTLFKSITIAFPVCFNICFFFLCYSSNYSMSNTVSFAWIETNEKHSGGVVNKMHCYVLQVVLFVLFWRNDSDPGVTQLESLFCGGLIATFINKLVALDWASLLDSKGISPDWTRRILGFKNGPGKEKVELTYKNKEFSILLLQSKYKYTKRAIV